MLDVLKHVRKIVSGELTVNAVMDEVVNVLNDDKVVAAGENLVKQSEQVLDAIEGVSGNKVVEDVMQIAEKAGITKDTVMEGIENIDVNELLVSRLQGNMVAWAKLYNFYSDFFIFVSCRTMPGMPSLMRMQERSSCLMQRILPLILFFVFFHPCRFLRWMV